jgi:serine/threonine protein phosphatase 1
MFLNAVAEPARASLWLMNGGRSVLQSYEIPYTSNMRDSLMEIYRTHKVFFDQLKTHVVVGDTLFVHAGVNPRKKIDEITDTNDHMWIRELFYEHGSVKYLEKQYGVRRVVFGHTIHDKVSPYHEGALLAIDTGSFLKEGRVSIVELLPDLKYKIVGQSS